MFTVLIINQIINKMKNYQDFRTLLNDMEKDFTIANGFVLPNDKKYSIERKINGVWETINLSQYKTSQDLILVETNNLAFAVSRWNNDLTISQQITKQTII